jgi:hypothetical protein
MGDGQTIEPVGPVLVQLPLHPDFNPFHLNVPITSLNIVSTLMLAAE